MVSVSAPFLAREGDLGGRAGAASVHRPECDEAAGHLVVVVNSRLVIFHQVELHDGKFIGCRMFARIGFDSKRVGESLSHEDGDSDTMPRLTVAWNREVVTGQLGLAVTPDRPEGL